jgi:hypothetical protein
VSHFWHSAKTFIFLIISLPSALFLALGKDFIFLIISLSSALSLALGKDFYFFLKVAECPLLALSNSLPSATAKILLFFYFLGQIFL